MGSLDYTKNVFDTLPAALPRSSPLPTDNLETSIASIISSLPTLDIGILQEDCLWRDSYALTGTLRTFYTSHTVKEVWKALLYNRGACNFKETPNSRNVVRLTEEIGWIEVRFEFNTTSPGTRCSGYLSLVRSEGNGYKIWVIRTILEQLNGAGDVDALQPTPHQAKEDMTQFDAVIIGGSQSGLSTGGRLQALGVNYVVLEKNAQVGDAWGERYESAKLHTIREYAHLPFDRTFGPEYGEYLSKNSLAEGHRKWAAKYGIKIWLSTRVDSGSWDAYRKLYTLKISRHGKVWEIRARHIVMATGAGSETPKTPVIANQEKYGGVVVHSVDYKDATLWKGKSGIVVGSANTGHDVADDMYESGLNLVTMVQRSRTYVLPVEYIESRYKLIYNDKIPTDRSDRGMFTNPVAVSRLLSLRAFTAMAKSQPERWAALEKQNFKVDPYGDIQEAINIRLGGHYIDVGTSAKISKGLIKVKSDSPIASYYEKGLEFADGTRVEADVIVFATGFIGNLKQHVCTLFGAEVAENAGDCFGLDSEGEVLGAFRPTGQPGLWYLGGALGHARYYSRYIALSIKADTMGSSLPVYELNKFNSL